MTLLQQYKQSSKGDFFSSSLALQYVTENAFGVSQLSLNLWPLKSVFPTLLLCPIKTGKGRRARSPAAPLHRYS